MSEREPTIIATFGIGYGRQHYAESVAEHAQEAGIPVRIVDCFQFLPWKKSLPVKAGYRSLSMLPSVYRKVRGRYHASEGIDAEALSHAIPDGSTVVTVSPVALEMIGTLKEGKRRILHMVGDRRVEPDDAVRFTDRVFVPGMHIEQMDLLPSKKTYDIGGLPHPYASRDTEKQKEQNARFHGSGPLRVLYAANGAGLGRMERTLAPLVPWIRNGWVKFSIFAGHRLSSLARVTWFLRRAGIEKDTCTIITGANAQDAVRNRMRVLPDTDIVVAASPMELSNGPWVSAVDGRMARNTREQANVRALTSVWGIDVGKDPYGLSVVLSQDKRPLLRMMRLNARALNAPDAATKLLAEVVRG